VRQRRQIATREDEQAELQRREDPAGLLALQRSAGNAAVTRALARRQLQRVGGWKGVNSKSPNAGEMSITDKGTQQKARRIPIDGIPQGNVDDDLNKHALTTTAKDGTKTDHTTSDFTSERPDNGKAIVVIPEGVTITKDTTVEVLLHLHGHTTGYRRRGNSARDINVEHIEEQVAAAAAGQRAIIAVLPQGQFKSIFGKGGKSFNPTDYLNSVWQILTTIQAWPEAPKRGGLILSGHSGADVAMEDMMDKAQTPKGSAEVAGLKALFLLDTMFGSNDADRVLKFVKFRLARDVAAVAQMPDEKDQVAWIKAHGFRLRGAHSGGHYKPQMKRLADGIKDWLADTANASPAVSAALAANIVIDLQTASGANHDAFVGEKENLRKALEMVP
jgi:hypothetical protein